MFVRARARLERLTLKQQCHPGQVCVAAHDPHPCRKETCHFGVHVLSWLSSIRASTAVLGIELGGHRAHPMLHNIFRNDNITA